MKDFGQYCPLRNFPDAIENILCETSIFLVHVHMEREIVNIRLTAGLMEGRKDRAQKNK